MGTSCNRGLRPGKVTRASLDSPTISPLRPDDPPAFLLAPTGLSALPVGSAVLHV